MTESISHADPVDTLLRDSFGLDGKLALVTGASSGIGAHLAQTLARAGAEVILTARREDRLAHVRDAIAARGGTGHVAAMDVTSAENIAAVFAGIAERHGRLDILLNNSGIAVTARAATMAEADWDRVLDTNLKGAFLVSQAAVPLLREARGTIINIASILGLGVLKGVSAYAASKAGLIQLTRAMALELARDAVRVNAIAPGYIATEINGDFFETDAGRRVIAGIPLGRLGETRDLDGALLLLAGPAGAFMTGSTIVVDGGHKLAMG